MSCKMGVDDSDEVLVNLQGPEALHRVVSVSTVAEPFEFPVADFLRTANPPPLRQREFVVPTEPRQYGAVQAVEFQHWSHGDPELAAFRRAAEDMWDRNIWHPPFAYTAHGGTREVTRELGIPQLCYELGSLAVNVANYKGDWGFDADAFRKAFEDDLGARITKTVSCTTITPLLYVHAPHDATMSLDPDVEVILSGSRKGKATRIAVEPVTQNEWAAMLGKADLTRSIGRPYFLPEAEATHAIKVTSLHHEVGDRITDAVLAAMRFQDEGQNDFGISVRYSHQPTWTDYRLNVMRFQSASKGPSTIEPWKAASWRPPVDFFSEMPHHWLEWRQTLAKGEEGTLATPVSRFGATYQKFSPEDRLVDLVIALEATVLNGLNEELGYRLALRGSYLAGGSNPQARGAAHETLRLAYNSRSKVVHGGKKLHDILRGKQEPRRLVLDVRRLVAKILAEYATAGGQQLAIKAVNEAVDAALLSGNWTPYRPTPSASGSPAG